jgi:L-alanine-DL-glutamate epimerase-like enolase superfamily enzyme
VVEYMNTSLETDEIWYIDFPKQRDGQWAPFSDRPGLGLELDPYAVEKWSM